MKRRDDDAGRHGVDANVVLDDLAREPVGERRDEAFRRRVHRRAGPPPTRAAIDVTLMMLPLPLLRMCGTAAEHAATTERTLRSITASKNASSISAIGTRCTRPPALLTRMSRPPKCAAVASTTSRAFADDRRSPPTRNASAPANRTSPPLPRRGSGSRCNGCRRGNRRARMPAPRRRRCPSRRR